MYLKLLPLCSIVWIIKDPTEVFHTVCSVAESLSLMGTCGSPPSPGAAHECERPHLPGLHGRVQSGWGPGRDTLFFLVEALSIITATWEMPGGPAKKASWLQDLAGKQQSAGLVGICGWQWGLALTLHSRFSGSQSLLLEERPLQGMSDFQMTS